jgi:hypothetical protein
MTPDTNASIAPAAIVNAGAPAARRAKRVPARAGIAQSAATKASQPIDHVRKLAGAKVVDPPPDDAQLWIDPPAAANLFWDENLVMKSSC